MFCSQASHCWDLLGTSPHLPNSKVSALSFEQLGEMSREHVEVVLLFKCQIRTGKCVLWKIQGGREIGLEQLEDFREEVELKLKLEE